LQSITHLHHKELGMMLISTLATSMVSPSILWAELTNKYSPQDEAKI